MTNLSLKEQLQALSLGTSQHETSKPASQKMSKKKDRSQSEKTKSKPAWLEQAQYGVELLKAYFPACFKDIKETQPLKVGIRQDLVKHLSTREDIVIGDKACMVNSLSYYVNSISYHKSVVPGANRIDLEGNPTGIVTEEEANYSVESRKTKMQKRKNPQNKETPGAVENTP